MRLTRIEPAAEEMIHLRLAVSAVLVAAIVAGCFTYFVIPLLLAESDQRLPPTVPDMMNRFDPQTPANIDQPRSSEVQAVAAFQRAAEAILRRAPNAQASAGDDQPIAGHIPLPKRRPIARP
jgi:hypothetical protein